MLARINEAYETLSNETRRKDYDGYHGLLKLENDNESVPLRSTHAVQKIISIDRVPPMEHDPHAENLLVAPMTDFQDSQQSSEDPQPLAPPTPPASVGAPTLAADKPQEDALTKDIAKETEWKGSFLKSIRVSRRIAIEELANSTKISKNYLLAIEEENFDKLPAAVFLRGFVTLLSKALKLPHEQVANAYMARYQKAKADKNSK
jgi:curved DNA-binding protein CbpA